MSRLLFLFICIPLIEVYFLFQMATIIGFWETVLLQVGTGFVGATLAKHEGLRVWLNIQNELAQGFMPTEKMIDGLMIFAGGLVLLTPGLLTDAMGILLLVPQTRAIFKKWAKKKFDHMSRMKTAEYRTRNYDCKSINANILMF